MKVKHKHQDYEILNLQKEMTVETIDEIVSHIQFIPEPPLLEGFVEEAMSGWRKSKQALPSPEPPVPLLTRQQMTLLFSQRWWQEVLFGVLLFAGGYFILSVTEMVNSMFILSIVGCIPLLVVVTYAVRNTLCGMGELACSFRIPLHRYVQARLLMAGAVTFLLNIGVTALVAPEQENGLILRMTLLWCIPILINSAAALIVSVWVRSFIPMTALLSMLPVFWMIVFSEDFTVRWTMAVELFWLMGLAVLSAMVLILAMGYQARVWREGGYLSGA